ncbi:MAG: serine protease [Prevotella sp.]|nr:serine protease [Prevotella sp.]
MKKLIFILIIQVCLMPALLYAQPKWAGKAAKSVFTLKTFKQDGSLLASGNGFFIGNEGEAVSNFSPFVGASRAVIIDASGKEMKVECITGANDLYDVARFRVSGKVSGLPVATTTTTGSTAWVLPYSANKSARSQQGTIEKIDKAGDYDYYTLAMQMPENTVGCPLLNENGEAIGIMQLSVGDSNKSYAIAVQFALGLKITGLSFNEQVYKSTSVKKDLPNELEQAIVALYVSGPQMTKESYREMIDDFIRKFPTAADGYTYRAQEEVNDNLFDDADRDMQQAVKMASKKDEAHFSFAKLIFQKEIFKNDRTYSGWTLDKAIAEADEAYRINPLSSYLELKGRILFAQKKYAEAYDVYQRLTTSDLNASEMFFNASRCKEMLGDHTAQLALLDSTINRTSRPFTRETAAYLFIRAQAYEGQEKYRQAISDYNEYEQVMRSSLNGQFYYIRSQAEVKARLFQQALNDLSKAIELEPRNTLFLAEKASLEVRVNLSDAAIETAQKLIVIDSQLSDGYLFLGIAQCQKGQKTEGLRNLQKAKELGNPQADKLITKYQ